MISLIIRIAHDCNIGNDIDGPFHNGDTNLIITGTAAWERFAASSIPAKCKSASDAIAHTLPPTIRQSTPIHQHPLASI